MVPNLKSQPLVSIIIPVYNGANYLNEAIDSALAQTYGSIEIIVVNDGSVDNGATEKIALSYGDKIRYLFKENGGVASALNAGIESMSGEYFSWLSHDDVYYPNKLAVQISYLQELGRPVMLYSDYDVIDACSRLIRTVSIFQYQPSDIRRALILDYPIHGCTAIIPKECFVRVGCFDERLKTTQDYDMWFRIAKYYDIIHMNMASIKSREHSEQGTLTNNSLHFKECNEFYIYSMRSIINGQTELNSTVSNEMFCAKCLISLSERGFHKASWFALYIYIKLILFEKNKLKLNLIHPIAYFIAINILRIKNIYAVLRRWKVSTCV